MSEYDLSDSAIVRWRNCHSRSTPQRFEQGRADTVKSRLRWPLSIVLIDVLRSRLATQAVISVKAAAVISPVVDIAPR